MKEWINTAIAGVLRGGVILSITIMLAGITVTFVHHPEYFSSRPSLGALTSPSTHFPNTLVDVLAGVRSGAGEAIVMAGLLVLIATPVVRVALSLIIFVKVRDRLYTTITSVVLLILLISFAIG